MAAEDSKLTDYDDNLREAYSAVGVASDEFDVHRAQVFATLALAAATREQTVILAQIHQELRRRH